MAEQNFGTYLSPQYPSYRLGTTILEPISTAEHRIYRNLVFEDGIYVAKSQEEADVIESNPWFGVKLFKLGEPKEAEGDEAAGSAEAAPAAPRKAYRRTQHLLERKKK